MSSSQEGALPRAQRRSGPFPSQSASRPGESGPFALHIERSLPLVWYKDEGGKSHCLDLIVSLRNAQGIINPGRMVRLGVRLLYDNKQLAPDRALRVVSPQTEPQIIPSEGTCEIKARIEEVSSKHGNCSFIIEVFAPDDDDIDSCKSSAVLVRSKRPTGSGASAAALPPSGPHPVAPGDDRGNFSQFMPTPAMRFTPGMPVAGPGPVAGCGFSRETRRALNSVVKWTNTIVKLLPKELQWVPVETPDGRVYICPCCLARRGSTDFTGKPSGEHEANCQLNYIMKEYSSQTQKDIEQLVHAIHGIADVPSQSVPRCFGGAMGRGVKRSRSESQQRMPPLPPDNKRQHVGYNPAGVMYAPQHPIDQVPRLSSGVPMMAAPALGRQDSGLYPWGTSDGSIESAPSSVRFMSSGMFSSQESGDFPPSVPLHYSSSSDVALRGMSTGQMEPPRELSGMTRYISPTQVVPERTSPLDGNGTLMRDTEEDED